MKNFTLLMIAIFVASITYGQTLQFHDNLRKERAPERNYLIESSVQPEKTIQNQTVLPDNKKGVAVVDVVEMGGAANGFGMLGVRRNLWIDEDINSVSFVHRMEDPPGSGFLAYDYSTDGGVSFEVNNQVYDPEVTGFSNARYPMGGIYNPEGNTDPSSAVFGYFAATLEGSNDIWGGYGCGAHQFSTMEEPTQNAFSTQGDFLQGVPAAFTITTQGLAIAADPAKVGSTTPYTDNMILTYGMYDSDLGDFDWMQELIEMPAGGEDINGVEANVADVKVAFSPDGQIGYVAYLSNDGEGGDVNLGCYYPILYKTTDGGANWDGPISVPLAGPDGLPWVKNYLTDEIIAQIFEEPLPDRDEIPYTSAFEFDLAVDAYGNPHMVFDVGVGSQEWSIITSYGGNELVEGCVSMMHVFSNNGGEEWWADTLHLVNTFRGEFPYTGGTPVAEDNRPYVASTMDGKKLFFSWIDTNLEGVVDNTQPDIFCKGYDIDNNSYSETYNVTTFSAAMWSSYMATGSKYAFDHGDGTYEIPFAYQAINPQELIEPVTFWYVDNFILTDDDLNMYTGVDIPEKESFYVSQNYPNPAAYTTRVSIHLDRVAEVDYRIYNLLGKEVWKGSVFRGHSGNNEISFDVSDLATGIYMYEIRVDDHSITRKMIVE